MPERDKRRKTTQRLIDCASSTATVDDFVRRWKSLTKESQEMILPLLLNEMSGWHCWKKVGVEDWLRWLFESAGLNISSK